MTLLDTIKSILGLDGSDTDSGGRNGARVERERSGDRPEPSTDTEAAVKTSEGENDADTAAAGASTSASTDTITDTTDDSVSAAEPSEAAGPSSTPESSGATGTTDADATDEGAVSQDDETMNATDASADVEGDAASADTDASGSTEAITDVDDDSMSAAEPSEAAGPTDAGRGAENRGVDDLKGIGPSYTQTLEDAGVETIADLADADAEELAEETGVSSTRIGRWIERAKARRQ